MPFTHSSLEIDKSCAISEDTRCRIIVTAPTNSYVRASSKTGTVDATVLNYGPDNTEYVIYPNSFGEWVVSYSKGTTVEYSIIDVDLISIYEVDLSDSNHI